VGCFDIAVGDFDSVSDEELLRIKAGAKEVIQAQPEKDDTDLELAVLACFERYPDACLTIFGAFGGRLDHHLASVFLPSDPEIAPFMSQLYLMDQQNYLCYRPAGRHTILPIAGYIYVAFMPVEGASFQIEGAKYPLNQTNYFKKAIYGSNEFINQPITLTIDRGYALIIYSKDGK